MSLFRRLVEKERSGCILFKDILLENYTQKRRKVANICDTRFHLAMHVAGDYIRTFGVKKGENVAKYEKKVNNVSPSRYKIPT